MKKLYPSIPQLLPAITGFVVAGIINVTGGNFLQTFMGLMTTAMGGYASNALINSRRSIAAQERNILRDENNRLHKALKIKAELDYLEEKQILLTGTIDDLQLEEKDLEKRIARIKKENYNLDELEKREAQSKSLKTEINELNGELATIKKQIVQRETQKNLLAKISADYVEKQTKLDELKKQLESLNQKVVELEIFRTTYDALKHEYEILENQQKNLSLEIPRLQAERDRITTEIQTIETKAQQADLLRRELEELESQCQIKRNSLTSLKRQMEFLDTNRETLENEIHLKELEGERKSRIIGNLEDEIKRLKEDLQEIKNSVKYAFEALNIPVTIKANTPKQYDNELLFLTQFKTYLSVKGLTFSDRVVNAFHTSLKVQDISALVILAGISGTGKSELPQAYAEFIGAPLVMLPVQPRWDSPQDLQGFFNYIEKKYKPTELMRYLYQHQRQSDLHNRMVLVLLDEMNLARVEYYFSDFLSKLETRRNKDTFLEIEAGSLKLSEEQKRVKIPEQFLFVGTMNEDETTQSLSDKVLDRANVLTFGKPPQLKLRGIRQNVEIPKEYLSWETFNSWCQQPQEGSSVLEDVKHYVNQVNAIMEALGRPFAHRVYQAIASYVINYPNALQDESIRKEAIADQFGQKLLPKLRGLMVEDSNVKPHLDRLKNLVDELGDESLKQAFTVACNGQYGQFQWKGMVYQEKA
ncbi:MAG: AAA family ATPase [Cyanobacterium sp.]